MVPLPAPGPTSRDEGAELAARFRALVQSPLRASLLRFLNTRPHETFDVDSLMSLVGRLRPDVEAALADLATCGLAVWPADATGRAGARQPGEARLAAALAEFLDERATISAEDESPAARRFREMIGRDEQMLVVLEWIRTAAKSDIAVLVLGPPGSGTDVVARMIHELGRRTHERFQTVNCATLTDALFEAEVFGYERGALGGAHERRQGRVELADRGTLFLDEIADLSLPSQARLLRVLEERQVERLGGQHPVAADVRLVSASRRPLEQLVRDGRFREDLYYRVNAFAIRLPALRERPSDIPILATRLVARYCATHGLPPDAKVMAPEALALLQGYPWPGNLREFESTVARAAITAPGRVIRERDVEFLHTGPAVETPPRVPTLREAESAHILRVLDATGWNKKEAARVLDISRGTLYRKIVEYDLEGDGPAGSTRRR